MFQNRGVSTRRSHPVLNVGSKNRLKSLLNNRSHRSKHNEMSENHNNTKHTCASPTTEERASGAAEEEAATERGTPLNCCKPHNNKKHTQLLQQQRVIIMHGGTQNNRPYLRNRKLLPRGWCLVKCRRSG